MKRSIAMLNRMVGSSVNREKYIIIFYIILLNVLIHSFVLLLLSAFQEAVNQCVMKFFERTVPLTEIDAHPLVLVIEKVLLHGFWGFREDFDKWLDAVFNKYVDKSQWSCNSLCMIYESVDVHLFILSNIMIGCWFHFFFLVFSSLMKLLVNRLYVFFFGSIALH